MPQHPYDQHPYHCRMSWGERGALEAAARGDNVVVVDVLRFSTTVATAVDRGASIIPCRMDDDAPALARSRGAELAVATWHAQASGGFSLSPSTFAHATPGTRVVLRSANGAVCAAIASDAVPVYTGALVNARAVAAAVRQEMERRGRGVTVVACGERWPAPSPKQRLRFAIEDYLGAGAVLSHLDLDKSPEALVCERAYAASRDDLLELLMGCGSGRELREKGLEADVRDAARVDVFDVAPVMRDGAFARG
jgi:2-phosphosulfolactate phosphatase